jgi:hypothetical protein
MVLAPRNLEIRALLNRGAQKIEPENRRWEMLK